jgi:hypothetical protein
VSFVKNIIDLVCLYPTFCHISAYTQNPFEVNLTIVEVKIRHDYT